MKYMYEFGNLLMVKEAAHVMTVETPTLPQGEKRYNFREKF